jgi:hypothetical protein
MLGLVIALGASISAPADGTLPDGLPRLEDRLIFLKHPIETFRSLLSKADSIDQIGSGTVTSTGLGIPGIVFRGI